MNENVKLARVKKMTKVSEIILKIVEIVGIIGVVALLLGGITMMIGGKKFSEELTKEGKLSVGANAGAVKFSVMEIEDDEIMSLLIHNAKSDVPAIQKMIDEGNVAPLYGMMFIGYAVGLLIATVGLHFLRLIFVKVKKADNPFAPEVLKQMRVSFIVITVGIVITSLSLLGIFIALGMWSIYCIFSYGCTIQELADETI